MASEPVELRFSGGEVVGTGKPMSSADLSAGLRSGQLRVSHPSAPGRANSLDPAEDGAAASPVGRRPRAQSENLDQAETGQATPHKHRHSRRRSRGQSFDHPERQRPRSRENSGGGGKKHHHHHHHHHHHGHHAKQPHKGPTGEINGQWSLLFMCFSGIMVSFVLYGIVLERATSGDKEVSELGIIFVTGCVYTATAAVGKKVRKEKDSGVPRWKMWILAVTTLLGTWCSIRALRYVIYPVRVLAKSCKPIPVLLVGVLLGKRYPTRKYISVLLTTAGVGIFLLTGKAHKASAADDGKEEDTSGFIIGLSLLAFSLLCDGSTGAIEDKFMSEHSVGPFDLMYNIQLGKTVLSLMVMLAVGELPALVRMLGESQLDLFLLGLTGAMGQVCIFSTISSFGALTTSIIGLLRKVVTLTLSVVLFGHHLTGAQFGGLSITVLGLAANFYRGGGGGGGGKKTAPEPAQEEEALLVASSVPPDEEAPSPEEVEKERRRRLAEAEAQRLVDEAAAALLRAQQRRQSAEAVAAIAEEGGEAAAAADGEGKSEEGSLDGADVTSVSSSSGSSTGSLDSFENNSESDSEDPPELRRHKRIIREWKQRINPTRLVRHDSTIGITEMQRVNSGL